MGRSVTHRRKLAGSSSDEEDGTGSSEKLRERVQNAGKQQYKTTVVSKSLNVSKINSSSLRVDSSDDESWARRSGSGTARKEEVSKPQRPAANKSQAKTVGGETASHNRPSPFLSTQRVREPVVAGNQAAEDLPLLHHQQVRKERVSTVSSRVVNMLRHDIDGSPLADRSKVNASILRNDLDENPSRGKQTEKVRTGKRQTGRSDEDDDYDDDEPTSRRPTAAEVAESLRQKARTLTAITDSLEQQRTRTPVVRVLVRTTENITARLVMCPQNLSSRTSVVVRGNIVFVGNDLTKVRPAVAVGAVAIIVVSGTDTPQVLDVGRIAGDVRVPVVAVSATGKEQLRMGEPATLIFMDSDLLLSSEDEKMTFRPKPATSWRKQRDILRSGESQPLSFISLQRGEETRGEETVSEGDLLSDDYNDSLLSRVRHLSISHQKQEGADQSIFMSRCKTDFRSDFVAPVSYANQSERTESKSNATERRKSPQKDTEVLNSTHDVNGSHLPKKPKKIQNFEPATEIPSLSINAVARWQEMMDSEIQTSLEILHSPKRDAALASMFGTAEVPTVRELGDTNIDLKATVTADMVCVTPGHSISNVYSDRLVEVMNRGRTPAVNTRTERILVQTPDPWDCETAVRHTEATGNENPHPKVLQGQDIARSPKVFGCEYMCGFMGSFEQVSVHESGCCKNPSAAKDAMPILVNAQSSQSTRSKDSTYFHQSPSEMAGTLARLGASAGISMKPAMTLAMDLDGDHGWVSALSSLGTREEAIQIIYTGIMTRMASTKFTHRYDAIMRYRELCRYKSSKMIKKLVEDLFQDKSVRTALSDCLDPQSSGETPKPESSLMQDAKVSAVACFRHLAMDSTMGRIMAGDSKLMKLMGRSLNQDSDDIIRHTVAGCLANLSVQDEENRRLVCSSPLVLKGLQLMLQSSNVNDHVKHLETALAALSNLSMNTRQVPSILEHLRVESLVEAMNSSSSLKCQLRAARIVRNLARSRECRQQVASTKGILDALNALKSGSDTEAKERAIEALDFINYQLSSSPSSPMAASPKSFPSMEATSPKILGSDNHEATFPKFLGSDNNAEGTWVAREAAKLLAEKEVLSISCEQQVPEDMKNIAAILRSPIRVASSTKFDDVSCDGPVSQQFEKTKGEQLHNNPHKISVRGDTVQHGWIYDNALGWIVDESLPVAIGADGVLQNEADMSKISPRENVTALGTGLMSPEIAFTPHLFRRNSHRSAEKEVGPGARSDGEVVLADLVYDGRETNSNVSRMVKSPSSPEERLNERTGGGARKDRDIAPGPWVLRLDLISAQHLPKMDLIGTSDPYVTFDICGQDQQKSKIIKNSLNPEWNENFVFHMHDLSWYQNDNELVLSIWDWNRMSKDEFMGEVRLKLADLCGKSSTSTVNVMKKGTTEYVTGNNSEKSIVTLSFSATAMAVEDGAGVGNYTHKTTHAQIPLTHALPLTHSAQRAERPANATSLFEKPIKKDSVPDAGVSERDMLVGLIAGLYTSIATRWPVDGTKMTSTDALKALLVAEPNLVHRLTQLICNYDSPLVCNYDLVTAMRLLLDLCQMDQGYVEQVLACERSMAAIMWLLRPFDVNSSKNNYQERAIEVNRCGVATADLESKDIVLRSTAAQLLAMCAIRPGQPVRSQRVQKVLKDLRAKWWIQHELKASERGGITEITE